MFWFMEGLCLLPTFLVISASSTFIVSYVIAVFYRHVDIIFPYISDTGALPPESCLFGLMTIITAMAGISTMYARYKFVEKINEQSVWVSRLNMFAFCIGILSCLGMCLVATFQETTCTIVHDLGAFLFFVTGVLYTIFQSIISYMAYPFGCSLALLHIRTVIAVIAFLAAFPTIICAAFVTETKLHRTTEDKDYMVHLVSAVFEWIVAFCFIFFFLTYIEDFKTFNLKIRIDFADDF
ncbi:hypothetical protein DPEC_G00113560 [Dallia pectoralis]|uniref:Uncharacterized protein n=1 Tax=Dallia pectoralis TaxID=75939 RepID=A0ACC2GTS9_DALPE|nr:hypothetical protein DPEC_G00113560 [Dallia pectoralis]